MIEHVRSLNVSIFMFLIFLLFLNPSLSLLDPQWQDVVYDEYNALIKNDGSLSRYKARLVANENSQQLAIDCDETFSLVVKPDTIRIILSIALTRHWHIHQLDVKNIFLNGDLLETVYMHQPSGFADPRSGTDTTFLLIYVDDIVLTTSFTALLQKIILSLHREFDMTDLGALNYLLGISVTRGLQYLTFTRPDLSYVVQQSCLYMHDPREPHLAALKRILRYVRGTLEFGLQLYASSGSSLVAYSDVDCADNPLFHALVLKLNIRGVANVVAETTWLHNLLQELHTPPLSATLMYSDNVSAVYLSANSVQHQLTKHIEIDIPFVRDMVAMAHVRVLHVSSRYQYANIFTKGLPSALFEKFRTSLSVRSPPAQTAGEC
ncbi:ribonuclease H-like domain-containing protein [Tanacetum coccineum]